MKPSVIRGIIHNAVDLSPLQRERMGWGNNIEEKQLFITPSSQPSPAGEGVVFLSQQH